MNDNKQNIALLFVISMLVYLSAFYNGFVWDDRLFILEFLEVRDLGNIPRFFFEGNAVLYRPLRTLLYAITYHFFGLKPIGYHLVGKLLNAFTVCTLYALIVLLFNNKRAAFWGALLFALHPIHTDRVTNMTASFDIMGDFFWLLAFTSYVAFRRGRGDAYLFCSLLLFTLGLLSSETAAVTPIVIVLYELTLGRKLYDPANPHAPKRSKPLFLAWGAYFAILAGYLAVRFSVLGVVSRTGTGAVTRDIIGNIVTMCGVVGQYFKFMLLPLALTPTHEVEMALRPFPVILVVATIGVMVAVGLALFHIKKRPEISFSFLWFFAVLSPNLNFIPTGTLMAERYIYVPSAMLSFFVALLFVKAGESAYKKLALVFAVIGAAYFAGTIVRNKDWQDEPSLWISAVKNDPSGDWVVANLSATIRNMGKNDDAEKILLSALKENPRKEYVLIKLGELYMDTGRYDEALATLKKVTDDPKIGYYGVQLSIATVLTNQGKLPEAEKKLEEIASKYPYGHKGLNNYGSLLFMEGKPGWPRYFVMAYGISPNIEYIINLASCYHLTGNEAAAVKVAKIGLSTETDNKDLKTILENASKGNRSGYTAKIK